MGDQGNWVSLVPPFAFEGSLSDYIVAVPHRLEDGLRPFPSEYLGQGERHEPVEAGERFGREQDAELGGRHGRLHRSTAIAPEPVPAV